MSIKVVPGDADLSNYSDRFQAERGAFTRASKGMPNPEHNQMAAARPYQNWSERDSPQVAPVTPGPARNLEPHSSEYRKPSPHRARVEKENSGRGRPHERPPESSNNSPLKQRDEIAHGQLNAMFGVNPYVGLGSNGPKPHNDEDRRNENVSRSRNRDA